MIFTIYRFPEEMAMQCPDCHVVHSRGEVTIETEVEGELYVYAELVTCCGDSPQPIPFLFDSPEPTVSYIREFHRTIQTPKDFFISSFVKKSCLGK